MRSYVIGHEWNAHHNALLRDGRVVHCKACDTGLIWLRWVDLLRVIGQQFHYRQPCPSLRHAWASFMTEIRYYRSHPHHTAPALPYNLTKTSS